MPDLKITEFDETTSLAPADIVPVVTDPDGAEENKKITLANLTKSIGSLLYPVGSYYINETDSTNPETLLGFGTWSAVTDKFLVGRGSTYTSTGGSATHTHALTTAYAKAAGSNAGGNSFIDIAEMSVASYNANDRVSSSGTSAQTGRTTGIPLGGSTDSASSNPPYQAIYCWKRTA